MSERQSVKVIIGGEEFTVRSELSAEYTQEVARYFDVVLGSVRGSLPTVEAHKTAILAGLAVTDELFQGRREDGETADRLSRLADELARMVPSGKRGAGSGPSSDE